jgi:hypothetical protein
MPEEQSIPLSEVSQPTPIDLLTPEEFEAQRKYWTQVGYFHAPLLIEVLGNVESAISQQTEGGTDVWLFDRDMYPFQVAKKTWGGNTDISYDLIPASSATLGVHFRNPLDIQISTLKDSDSWEEASVQFDEYVSRMVDNAINSEYDAYRGPQLIAFTRYIADLLHPKNNFTDKEIEGLLKQDQTQIPTVRNQPKNIVLFDSYYLGTYVEVTREILRRVKPGLQVYGVLLRSQNPRLPSLVTNKAITSFESLPKPIDILPNPISGKVIRSVRGNRLGTLASAVSSGIRFGIKDLQEGTYGPITIPPTTQAYCEPDLHTKNDAVKLFEPWIINEVNLGDFKQKH